jgi:hypothetical protein
LLTLDGDDDALLDVEAAEDEEADTTVTAVAEETSGDPEADVRKSSRRLKRFSNLRSANFLAIEYLKNVV